MFLLPVFVSGATIVSIVPYSVPKEELSIIEKIENLSGLYNVDPHAIINTINCESEFVSGQSRIPNKTGPNGREDSWGIAQIHLPSHPDVSKEEALDPSFSIEWMIKKWAEGKAGRWTCARQLGYNR